MNLDLDAIEARCEAATEGPWMADGSQIYPVAPGTVLVAATRAFSEGEPTPDADFIAHARTDIPALVAALRRVESLADEWANADEGYPAVAYYAAYFERKHADWLRAALKGDNRD